MTDTKQLRVFRKQAMTNLETDLRNWTYTDDFSKSDIEMYQFLWWANKRKTNAPAYNKLKKEVKTLIKWDALKDDFGYNILKQYGYETYLKLQQDLDISEEIITISYAVEYICCYM
mgnify:FL=1|tara:strand:+ start:268 stop:615 length:348 start_codon:yes stop_codon:yes gene_type:complete